MKVLVNLIIHIVYLWQCRKYRKRPQPPRSTEGHRRGTLEYALRPYRGVKMSGDILYDPESDMHIVTVTYHYPWGDTARARYRTDDLEELRHVVTSHIACVKHRE